MARYPLTLFTPGSLIGGGANDSFLALHREMNRLFDDAMRGGVSQPGGSGNTQAGALLAPHMDVSETDKEVRIQAELPGVSEKDIEVSLNDDVLSIRAEKHQERREERHGTHFSERAYGTFQRSLRLPFPVNQDQVQAQFENGVLSVTLPKSQPQERSHRIQVQGPQQGKNIQASQESGNAAGPATAGQQSNDSRQASNDATAA